jgi:hypothetical protein
MRKWWIVWPLYAGLMGFVLGASFFFGFYGRNVTEGSIAAQHEQQPTNEPTKSRKEESDEALALYTLWLMGFTGVLAFATIGLGIATAFLYATGEKQFRVALRASIKQSRDMQASVAAAESAVLVSRQVGESQVRAYLSCVGGTYTVFDSWLAIEVRIRNHGQSPAVWTGIKAQVVTQTIGGLRYERSETLTTIGPAIAAGQDGKIFVVFLHGQMGEGAHDAIRKDGKIFDVRGQISWRDVFGKTRDQDFLLDKKPDAPISKGERSGEMTSYNHASQQADQDAGGSAA